MRFFHLEPSVPRDVLRELTDASLASRAVLAHLGYSEHLGRIRDLVFPVMVPYHMGMLLLYLQMLHGRS